MVTKSLKLEAKMIENLEIVIQGLNKKKGTNIYDFSNIVRIALNEYLNSDEIKEVISFVKNIEEEKESKKNILMASETSLLKDWMSAEEDETWADL